MERLYFLCVFDDFGKNVDISLCVTKMSVAPLERLYFLCDFDDFVKNVDISIDV